MDSGLPSIQESGRSQFRNGIYKFKLWWFQFRHHSIQCNKQDATKKSPCLYLCERDAYTCLEVFVKLGIENGYMVRESMDFMLDMCLHSPFIRRPSIPTPFVRCIGLRLPESIGHLMWHSIESDNRLNRVNTNATETTTPSFLGNCTIDTVGDPPGTSLLSFSMDLTL